MIQRSSVFLLLVSTGVGSLVWCAFANAAIGGAGEFSRLDANKDGLVSTAENVVGTKAIFQGADANRDDLLTVTELAIAEERRTDSAPRRTTSVRKSVSAGLREAAEQIKAMDENGDGEASFDEMMASAQQVFSLLDVNHDGYLDSAESEAGR